MKNIFSIKCLFCSVLFMTAAIQEISAYNGLVNLEIDLREVSFEDGTTDNNHTLVSDDNTEVFENPHYTNPEDTQEDGKRFPTAYTKGTTPKVEMKFYVNLTIYPGVEPPTLWVKADGTEGRNLIEKSFSLVNGPQTLTYELQATSQAFTDKIKFYGPGIGKFEFDWKYSIDNKQTWTSFHTSKHRIYLTVAKPTPKVGNRETLFYYGCNQPNGDPGSNHAKVTTDIWNDFASRSMYRIDSKTGHLKSGPSEVLKFVTTSPNGALPENVNAVCTNWSGFFRDVLKVHDFEVVKIDVTAVGMALPPGVNDIPGGAWLVPNQTIAADGRSVATAASGLLRGQGNDPSRADKEWPGHTIVSAFGKYYDPSYGIGECISEADYEAKATSGFKAAKERTFIGIVLDNPPFYWAPTRGSKTLVYGPAAIP